MVFYAFHDIFVIFQYRFTLALWVSFISDFLHYDSSSPMSQLQCTINKKPAFFFFFQVFSFYFCGLFK